MRRIILAVLLALLLPVQSWAAVAFDVAATGSGASAISVGITVGAGSDRVLIVYCGGDTATTAVSSISGAGATWGGTAFATFTTAGGGFLELWSGTGPTTGAQTVSITHGAGNTVGCIVTSWNGANQTTPLASASSLEQTATPINRTYTTVSGDGVVLGYLGANGPTGGSAGSCNSANVANQDGRVGPGSNWQTHDHCVASGTSTQIGFAYNGVVVAGVLGAIIQQPSTASATFGFRRRVQ
jgi:hypothetical protein